MNVTNLNGFPFQMKSSRSYGMVSHIGKPEKEEAVRNACILAAALPFNSLRIERVYDLQNLERNLPQFMLAEQLRSMEITTTPMGVYDPTDKLIGILTDSGALYITANGREDWERHYCIDLDTADDTRRKRASYYIQRTGLEPPAQLHLPTLTREETELLDKKCRDGLPFPQLCRGGVWMPIFNAESTVTVSRHPKQETNPNIWYDSVNMGVLLPMAQAFVDKLNDETITGFDSRVRAVANSTQLEMEVEFVLDGERITHCTRRPMVNFASGAVICVPFGEFGSIVHSRTGIRVDPSLDCRSLSFESSDWNVIQIQGGVKYVRMLLNDMDQGMLRLPVMPMQKEAEHRVIVSADIGESYFALATKLDDENPQPVVFDSTQDVFPLVYASERNVSAICNLGWFPRRFQGMARSIAQFFRAPDGNLHEDAAPYSVSRSFTDTSISSITLARTLENGLSAGFKGDMIRSQNDAIKEYAYQGYLAAVLILGIHQALKHGTSVELRLAYPNNPAFKKRFCGQINRALQLIHQTLVNRHNEGFRFATVDYRTEAFCCAVAIERLGINRRLGASLRNCLNMDVGGITLDLAVRLCSGEKYQLASIPMAGKSVTLSSMIQVARCLESDSKCGLNQILRKPDPALETLLEQQMAAPIRQRLHAAAAKADSLVQLTGDNSLLEACQTIIDHFKVKLGPNAQLLRGLICLKDLMLLDVAMAQSGSVFTDAHLAESRLHLLRLGNGSKSIDLICDPDNCFQNGRDTMDEILARRAVHHLGEKARLSVEYNTAPKTEVVNGLSVYTASDAEEIRCFRYDDPVADLQELEKQYLSQAIVRVRELTDWLRVSVPAIVGNVHPYYSGLERGFDQLLEQFEDQDDARAVLLDTLAHERGRFGQLHGTSASLGVDLWVMFAILDSVDRQLAHAQAAWMEKKGVI